MNREVRFVGRKRRSFKRNRNTVPKRIDYTGESANMDEQNSAFSARSDEADSIGNHAGHDGYGNPVNGSTSFESRSTHGNKSKGNHYREKSGGNKTRSTGNRNTGNKNTNGYARHGTHSADFDSDNIGNHAGHDGYGNPVGNSNHGGFGNPLIFEEINTSLSGVDGNVVTGNGTAGGYNRRRNRHRGQQRSTSHTASIRIADTTDDMQPQPHRNSRKVAHGKAAAEDTQTHGRRRGAAKLSRRKGYGSSSRNSTDHRSGKGQQKPLQPSATHRDTKAPLQRNKIYSRDEKISSRSAIYGSESQPLNGRDNTTEDTASSTQRHTSNPRLRYAFFRGRNRPHSKKD